MADIIEQAEAALDAVKLTGNDPVGSVGLINALLVALKAARAEADQWKAHWRQNTETASVAIRERDEALAENERLRSEYRKMAAPRDYWGNPR